LLEQFFIAIRYQMALALPTWSA